MSWILDGRPLQRVLVTRLRYLGDIAMATVVLEVLHRGDAGLELGFLCEAQHAPLIASHPLLSRCHGLSIQRHGADAAARSDQAAGTGIPATRGTLGTIAALRRARYDLAVDLFFNPRSAWLLRLASIRARIAGSVSPSRQRLYTHQAPSPSPADRPDLFAVAGGVLGEHLSRLAPLRHADGRLFLDWLADTYTPGQLRPRLPRPALTATARVALTAHGLVPGEFTLLAPGATWPAKEWPLAHWRELVTLLQDGANTPVAVLCPPGSAGRFADLGAALASGGGGLLAPLPLTDALAVTGAAARVVSVDGGIMHAAVAYGVPTLALFGPTDPGLWFPYEQSGPYRVLATRPVCHPCHRHVCDEFICLPDLQPAQVAAALASLDHVA